MLQKMDIRVWVLFSMVFLPCWMVVYAELDTQGPNYRVLCGNLKPVEELDISELSGSWLTVESLLLRDGYPETPNNKRRTCIRTTFFDATNAGLSATSEVRVGTSKRRTGRSKFVVTDAAQPGRWEIRTRRPTSFISELLVLAARPTEYVVLAFCLPKAKDAEEGDPQPALWIKIMARGAGLHKRELTSLRKHLSHMLGVQELASVHFDTSC